MTSDACREDRHSSFACRCWCAASTQQLNLLLTTLFYRLFSLVTVKRTEKLDDPAAFSKVVAEAWSFRSKRVFHDRWMLCPQLSASPREHLEYLLHNYPASSPWMFVSSEPRRPTARCKSCRRSSSTWPARNQRSKLMLGKPWTLLMAPVTWFNSIVKCWADWFIIGLILYPLLTVRTQTLKDWRVPQDVTFDHFITVKERLAECY